MQSVKKQFHTFMTTVNYVMSMRYIYTGLNMLVCWYLQSSLTHSWKLARRGLLKKKILVGQNTLY